MGKQSGKTMEAFCVFSSDMKGPRPKIQWMMLINLSLQVLLRVHKRVRYNPIPQVPLGGAAQANGNPNLYCNPGDLWNYP